MQGKIRRVLLTDLEAALVGVEEGAIRVRKGVATDR
jgi:hypothetical protein